MAALRKYPDVLRERAVRLAVEARRIAQLERDNRELRRANEILRTASAFSPRRSSTAG